MKKVAFFLDNKAFASVDCSDILKGNPGIGGTENMFYVISTLLSCRDNDLEVKLFITADQVLPKVVNFEIVGNLLSCIRKTDEEAFDFLVIKHDVKNIYNDTLRNSSNIQFIIWAHVFMCFWELDYYAKLKKVYKIVNVGREALDLYIDHPAYEKSCFIYNCVPLPEQVNCNLVPFEQRQPIVTYIGQLAPFKGFHLLAEAWPKVVSEIPDAQLYVIGTGKLYDRNSLLGSYGLAEVSYEQRFVKYLTDDDGNILPGVHFMGVMGKEKEDILAKTKVGVPNPSGITETFCISAVEMQIQGAFVVTIKAPGYLDTVKNGSLYSSRKRLAEEIVKALRRESDTYVVAQDYFKQHFSYEAVAKEWERLINNDIRPDEHAIVNSSYRLKWLKRLLRVVKMRLPFLYRFPYLERIMLFVERLLKGRITYLDSNIQV